MNQTKVCIAVSSQQYIMIDEQIAFCLLITTQKADDHRRLGPCKTMAQIPFDSSPEGPNERSKCPKHRERGQENFFCWPLKYITRRLCNWNVRVSLKMLQMMHRLACCIPGLKNANSAKGWDLWSLTNGILCVCSSSFVLWSSRPQPPPCEEGTKASSHGSQSTTAAAGKWRIFLLGPFNSFSTSVFTCLLWIPFLLQWTKLWGRDDEERVNVGKSCPGKTTRWYIFKNSTYPAKCYIINS